MHFKSNFISVIIPVYNTQDYLLECFSCLDNQTFKDFEVIFVNDGSTDDSPQMLANYALNHQNVKIINQVNKGVSAAKNAGVSAASGEFVYFMDSDDYIHPQTLQILFDTIKKTNTDIVTCGVNFVNYKRKYNSIKFKKIKKHSHESFYCNDDFIARYLVWNPRSYIFIGGNNKLLRTHILKQIKTYPDVYDTKLSYGEDTNLICKYLMLSKSLACVKKRLYFYRQRSNSILHSGFYEKLLTLLNCLDPLNELDKTKFNKTSLQKEALQCSYALDILIRIIKSKYSNQEIIKRVYSIYKNNLKFVRKSKYTPWYIKFFTIISKIYVKPKVASIIRKCHKK